MFGLSSKTAQLGQEESERVTQNLMMAYAVGNSEVAMYESLAVAARLAGDTATEALARRIQQQERESAEKCLPSCRWWQPAATNDWSAGQARWTRVIHARLIF